MSSTRFLYPPSQRIALSAARIAGLGLALALIAPGSVRAQPPPVPDASTVPPAAVVDKPLQPAVAQEVMEERPSPQHEWVPGHWRWQDGAYVWVSAHWELPPIPNAVWVAPRWEAKANGYVLVEGFWQQPAPPATPAAPPPTPQEEVVVDVPPPPPYQEVIVERPSPLHIWISGYWGWRGGRHVWIAGHWELPPRENVVWVPPRWELRGNRYVLIQGYWRDASVGVGVGAPVAPGVTVGVAIGTPATEVIVSEPPPPLRVEHRPRPPGPGYIWISGYWAIRDRRQVWIAGHWEFPPRGRTVWIEPRWERRGGNYVFVEGYWR
jgi:hypothetical protein